MWTKIKNAARKAWMAVVAGVLAVLGFLGLHDAQSQSTTQDVLTWTHPTQYVDGTALPANLIAKTVIVWGNTPGGPWPNTVDVPAPATTLTVQRGANPYGTRCYKAATVLTTGAQSSYSVEGCKTVAQPSKAPTDLAVQ
jgi:hypothetical protein